LAPHAFLWTRKDGIRDLGTLPGDATSQGSGINAPGRVVGQSCDAGGVCRGFVWDRGTMRDLQPMIVSGDDVYVLTANDIDDLGRITGQGVDNATGRFVAFLATPIH
jgi:probable HAF family extracellular repeat protein